MGGLNQGDCSLPVIERDKCPEGVFRKEALDHLDDLVERVDSMLERRIVIPSDDTGFRVPNMARTQSQCFLLRCSELGHGATALVNEAHWLSALIVGRALVETIASYVHFERKLADKIREGDIKQIHDFICEIGFGTRLEHLVDQVNDPGVFVTNIITQINSLKTPKGKSVRDDYDHLCEYAHPNAFGTFLFFGKHDTDNDQVNFKNDGQYPEEAFHWIGFSIHLLEIALFAAEHIEAHALAISRIEKCH